MRWSVSRKSISAGARQFAKSLFAPKQTGAVRASSYEGWSPRAKNLSNFKGAPVREPAQMNWRKCRRCASAPVASVPRGTTNWSSALSQTGENPPTRCKIRKPLHGNSAVKLASRRAIATSDKRLANRRSSAYLIIATSDRHLDFRPPRCGISPLRGAFSAPIGVRRQSGRAT
jgi:hypothetical protein